MFVVYLMLSHACCFPAFVILFVCVCVCAHVCVKGGGGSRKYLIIDQNHTYKFYVNTFYMLKIKYMMMVQIPEVFSSG